MAANAELDLQKRNKSDKHYSEEHNNMKFEQIELAYSDSMIRLIADGDAVFIVIYSFGNSLHFRARFYDLKIDMVETNQDKILSDIHPINTELHSLVDWMIRGYAGSPFNNPLLIKGNI